jgi:hypothetical protein
VALIGIAVFLFVDLSRAPFPCGRARSSSRRS